MLVVDMSWNVVLECYNVGMLAIYHTVPRVIVAILSE